LRPHCKTHKTREIVRLLLQRGVTRHKCATVREAEMCLEAGARDVVLAYQVVGPAVEQFVDLAARVPDARLAALVDTESAARWLSEAAQKRGVVVGAMVDLDTGLHRSGVPVGEAAYQLYQCVAELPGLRAAGFQVYDAQNNAYRALEERQAAIERTLEPVLGLAEQLERAGYEVPEIVCGGSPTFPCYATWVQANGGRVTCSPGTTALWDYGYTQTYPDLSACFKPAALLFSRVVSRPTAQHLTLDLGTKAIAADPPLGKRGLILGLEDATTVLHNEEHWSVTSAQAGQFKVGDGVLVVPTHICPCTNLHPVLYVLDKEGNLSERWEVAARQRPLVL
jgi:D-threonine aldolase